MINNDKKLIRFKDESIETKKKKIKYSPTTYTIQLIRFYNCFIRLFKFIWLNIIFFYTLFELIKIPFYFLFSSLSTNLNYNNNDDDCDLNANKKDNKLIKPKKNFFDRTLLNNLIRKSNNKKFVLKYFDDYIDDDHDKIKNKSNYKFSVENENNVILVNEVKSNTVRNSVSFDSLNDMNKIEKTFLTLDNCKEINLNNDGNKKKLKY